MARYRYPSVHWSVIGLPVTVARVHLAYRDVMESCGLTATPSRRARASARLRNSAPVAATPRRGRLRPNASGFTLRLRMRPGQDPSDFEAASDRLRHAWGVEAVHVRAVESGWVELRVLGWDVLEDVRMPRTRPSLLRVPIALRADGVPHWRDFREVPHELNLGATKSGKSMYQRSLVRGLAPQPVALVGIDCKWGVELAPFAPRLSALATDPEQAEEVLGVLIAEMEDRYLLIRRSQGISLDDEDSEITSDIWDLPESERPVPIVVLLDEIAELFLTAGGKPEEQRRQRIVNVLIRLAQLGRAAGIYLEVCGQRFGAELGNGATMLRAQLTGRVCHRVNDEASARMALADIGDDAVTAATSIHADRPGTAVAADTSGGWTHIRTPHHTLADVAWACAENAHMVPDLPALAPFAPAVTLATAPGAVAVKSA
ncbi:FtsK/SpoIIIE domain-containing protein [Embleya sp. NPDC008237]|uniref:FtsK/SpoIIIE domain-containing protein n=1 Tax=Embleya sp. NPDC008237 TaxID=3363978 RepID=UPI0036E3952C